MYLVEFAPMKKYLKYLLLILAALIILPLTGCFCSQLYTQHRVSGLMNYAGMSKDEVLRRVSEIELANYQSDPPDNEFIRPITIEFRETGSVYEVEGDSYEAIKDAPLLKEEQVWSIHHRLYGLSSRTYYVKLHFNEAGIVDRQEVRWYIAK